MRQVAGLPSRRSRKANEQQAWRAHRRGLQATTLVVVVVLAVAAAVATRALTVQSVNPLWLQEHFIDTVSVATYGGACINTAAPGVARLCEVPWSLATDPGGSRYFVADKQGNAKLFASDGSAMADVSAQLPAVPGAVDDADWGQEALAVLTVGGWVYGYAQGGDGRLVLAPGYTVQVPGAISVAAGPGLLLVAGPASITAYAWDGASLQRLPAFDLATPAARIRLSRDGARLLAILPDGRLLTWARAEAGWMPGPGLAGTVKAANFMPSGAGLWTADNAAARAYAFVPGGGLTEVGLWRINTQARALAPGFAGQDVLLLASAGVDYYAAGPDGVSRVAAYSAAVTGGSGYESQGTVVSVVYVVDHNIDMVRIEAQETLPAGTNTAYEVSTDCGATWTVVPINTNTTVPLGSCIAWRATLATTDPAQTPVVDIVDVLEVAQVTRRAASGEVVMKLVQ